MAGRPGRPRRASKFIADFHPHVPRRAIVVAVVPAQPAVIVLGRQVFHVDRRRHMLVELVARHQAEQRHATLTGASQPAGFVVIDAALIADVATHREFVPCSRQPVAGRQPEQPFRRARQQQRAFGVALCEVRVSAHQLQVARHLTRQGQFETFAARAFDRTVGRASVGQRQARRIFDCHVFLL
ncbi:hypothetical protein G6F35_016243 [Rhizopus arrhizus]|nr:hypothetical protein G6F35_016243 [Rhizopus arrhizus]